MPPENVNIINIIQKEKNRKTGNFTPVTLSSVVCKPF